jgi:hypothetical protein
MAKKPPQYIDQDSSPDFLDLPDIRYSDGTRPFGKVPLEQWIDPVWRREQGLDELPKLPPPVDH